ncbi:MAG: hypothetical protein IKL04_06250 [Lachnospiraceae bacterium]|nr:hypothetical protein [Lachnospiraceae bacterium]
MIQTEGMITMPLMDEFKEEREAIKNAPLKTKLIYFFDYYKGHVITAAILLFVIGSLIHHFATYKETIFHTVLMNSIRTDESQDVHPVAFAEMLGVDTDEYDVHFDTTIYITDNYYDDAVVANIQKLVVYQMAGDVDTLICEFPRAESYIYNGALDDITKYMTPEQKEILEPYFLYADQALVDKLMQAHSESEVPEEMVCPDPLKPEEMENPFPVGISLKDCPSVTNDYYLPEMELNLHIFKCTPNPEYCTKFIDYICSDLLQP